MSAPLERAITIVGGLTALAKRIGTRPNVIVHWRKRGIPAERVLSIEKATEAEVTRYELRPDIYPPHKAAK